MKISKFIRLIVVAFLISLSLTTYAEKRVALIIGNSSYGENALGFQNLPACVNDAAIMGSTLKSLSPSFQTLVVTDANKEAMNKAISDFNKMSKDADVALFFFSGHACRIDDDLYLVPSNTNLSSDILSDQLVRVRNVENGMRRNSKLSLLFFDACRDDAPVDPSNSKGGVAAASNIGSSSNTSSDNSPIGCVSYFATQDGKKADAGNDRLSPFTKVLVKHLTDGDEFTDVWVESIIREVEISTNNKMTPSNVGVYSRNFYFNKGGKTYTTPADSYSSNNTSSNKKSIKLECSVPDATLKFRGDNYEFNKSYLFEIGGTYIYTVDAPGYESYSGKIEVSSTTPSVVNVELKKIQPATLVVRSNRDAAVYLDNNYAGAVYKGQALKLSTTTGKHAIKLTANHCADYKTEITLTNGETSKFFTLEREIPIYWKWDGYEGQQSMRYHFSPKYQIGLSYMYKPEDTRFSFGLYLAASPGWFKGFSVIDISSSIYVGTSTSVIVDDGNGNQVEYKSTTIQEEPDRYSSDIDPNSEAKKYDANSMALANIGFNITNGISIEAGFGVAYHQNRYYMPNVNYIRTTTLTNESTGEILGEPEIEVVPQNTAKWFKQDTKWSPALRLGVNGLIPLDGWDKYFISVGAGYTFLFTNNEYSSWDANIGLVWKF
ncbi:MAG: caspase family protein [Muribaculaceae bacterium]|nr:caspase family protein [Muribaculaceae bacterium]